MSLVDIIASASGPLSPEQLFTTSNFDVEEVEIFYRELGRLIDDELIREDANKNLIKGAKLVQP